MRLFPVTRILSLGLVSLVLASCGGGSNTSTSPTPTTITASPTSSSLTHGDVIQLSVQVLDQNNNAISPAPTITYASSDSSVTVTSTGLVCAGIFDSNNIVCQIKDSSGNLLPDKTVNITISGAGLSTTVPVYVHGHVDAVTVSGPANPPLCVSQNQTEQFTAKAFSSGQDITSKVGPFTWSTGAATIATVDANGILTSHQPGATTVVASVANTTGTPALVVACPPKMISLHVASATDTNFSVAASTAVTLAADVTDILGQPIVNAPLTFSSYIPTAATVTSSNAGGLTTPGAGKTSVVASCLPPGCNPAAGPNVNFNGTGAGLAVYSNPVIGTITGTTATTIYVTGKDNPDGSANTSLIPIDSAANTAGTAITLAGSPNSMVFNRTGTQAFIGSTAGMLVFDPGTNTVVATASGITGVVLSVSNDGRKVVVSDTSVTSSSNGKVFVFDANANSVQVFDLAGITAADFASDNSKAYFTNGSTVYEYSPATGLKTLSFGADGVAFTPQTSVAYFGGGSITGIAVCNDTRVDNASAAANILRPTPDGTHMVGVGPAGWADLNYSVVSSSGCPPTASNTLKTAGFPAFVGTPAQIAVAPDDSNAFLTGYTGGSAATGVPFYHLADGSTGAVALAGGGGVLFSGGITQDGASLYVGVGANGSAGPQVHRVDLKAANGPTDANQINVSFNPRIVVVRPK